MFSNGYSTYDMKFTNDTPNTIVIVAGSTFGSRSTITVQFWSLPTGRTVTFNPEAKTNYNHAYDTRVYTTTLAPGVESRAEYPADGYETTRTRTVTDASGNVIHSDTWSSRYARVTGVILVGQAGPPAPLPPPPAPAVPAVLPAGGPAVAQAPRRRAR